MNSLETRIVKLEETLGERALSNSEVVMIREKIKARIPRLIEKADAGDDDSLRLLAVLCPDLEPKLTELAESGKTDARECLERLHKARTERQALLQG